MSLRERTRPGLGIIEPCLQHVQGIETATAARTLRAARTHTGEMRDLLEGIATSYKKRALKEELKRGEHPRSKKRTTKKK